MLRIVTRYRTFDARCAFVLRVRERNAFASMADRWRTEDVRDGC
jgi:hypothetical protein